MWSWSNTVWKSEKYEIWFLAKSHRERSSFSESLKITILHYFTKCCVQTRQFIIVPQIISITRNNWWPEKNPQSIQPNTELSCKCLMNWRNTSLTTLKLLMKCQSFPSVVRRNISPCTKSPVLQMYCSSSAPFMSNDHLPPSSSIKPLRLGSLSEAKEERDTWLVWSQGDCLEESLLLSSIPMWTLIWEGVSGFMRPWACAS